MSTRPRFGEALVLRTRPLGESDLIAVLLWEDGSRMEALGRGARASRRRFTGCLLPFSHLRVSLAAGKPSRWPSLEEAVLLDGHQGLRTELRRTGQAAYAVELAECFSLEGEPNRELWRISSRVLSLLDERALDEKELAYLEMRLLEASGLAPVLEGCLQCGRQASERWIPDAAGQGFYCRECHPSGRGGRAVSAAAMELLRRLRRRELKCQAEAVAVAEARQVLAGFLEEHGGRRFRSREFLLEVGEK